MTIKINDTVKLTHEAVLRLKQEHPDRQEETGRGRVVAISTSGYHLVFDEATLERELVCSFRDINLKE